MDNPEQRNEFIKNYPICYETMVLNDKLKSIIYSKFPTLWTFCEPSDEIIKSYILLELTKTRELCKRVIKILKSSENEENFLVSQYLSLWNTSISKDFNALKNEIKIDVKKGSVMTYKEWNSLNFSMNKNPRGKAIIINVVPKEVLSEHKRFKHIFSQLLFDAIVYEELTIAEMIINLTEINNQIINRLYNGDADEALIVMMISHGHDDMVCGKNYVSAVNDNLNDPNDPKYELASNDLCHMSRIVDIFQENRDLVKMFYFICCRKVTQQFMDMANMNSSYANGMDSNKNTFVFYSCGQGYVTPKINHWPQTDPQFTYGQGDMTPINNHWFPTDPHFTFYGKYLSESIAQYAYYEDLSVIMNKTNQTLQKLGKRLGLTHQQMGLLAPENRLKCQTHKLYFNPGLVKGKPLKH